MKFKNDDAQIAVILMFFLCLVMVAFYWAILGGLMDQTTSVHNNITADGGLYTSQDRQDSMSMLGGTFSAFPILAFILIIISAVIAAIASKYSTV